MASRPYEWVVKKTPGVCGGSGHIIRTRIPVWTIERHRQLGASDDEILAQFPSLRPTDLLAAYDYVRDHREEIEEEIKANEDA